MIRPNYAVKALIPYPKTEDNSDFTFLKKADTFITCCYRKRKKTYGVLLLFFCMFSVLGLFFYNYSAYNLVPISLYLPIKSTDVIDIKYLFSFRQMHMFASLFVFLSGFTVFGNTVSALFLVSDAFVIGFSLQYSISYLMVNSNLGVVLLYFICISLFILVDLLFCCEVIKFSKNARGGTKEMLVFKRFAFYILSYILIILFSFSVTYLFKLISK